MIAKSDLIILTVSTAALAVGLYRWQQGSESPLLATSPSPPIERVVDPGPDEPTTDDPTATFAGNRARRDGDPVTTPSDDAPRVRRVIVDDTDGVRTTGTDARAGDAGPTTSGAASAPTGSSPANPSPNAGESLYGRYLVVSGDYLGKLADRFGTSVATLQSINDIDGTTIHVGEELLYPLPAN